MVYTFAKLLKNMWINAPITVVAGGINKT